MQVKLHQFAFSHFNEKARWALAHKGVPHDVATYLPGPHMPAIRRLSGQTSTPVLEMNGETVVGSAAIIERLESEFPDNPLHPEAEDLKRQALAFETEFDEIVGPAVRTVVFSVLVNEGAYLVRMFGGSKSLPKRLAYRASFPLAKGVIARGNGVNPENVARSHKITQETLDRVAERTANHAYMVGDQFSVADLTAAALLAPVANVDHVDMKRPEPVPAAFRELVTRYSHHPAVTWVNTIYRNHRR